MNILTISDLHGRDTWKQENLHNYDLIIFLGDYCDSLEYKSYHIFDNLQNIINLKEKYGNKIILLWGNHDIQYLFAGKYQCSGYREEDMLQLNNLFKLNKQKFQLAFQYNNYIWSHAGIHKGWWNLWIKDKGKIKHGENIADTLNRLFNEQYEPIFHCGIWRGGKHKVGGPLWLDRNEMGVKPIEGYHQIVGHTPTKKRRIVTITNFKNKNTSITYTDNENFENYKLDIE